MTIRATGGLSIAEVERIEAQLRSEGYQRAPSDAWEIGPRQYSVSRAEEEQRRAIEARQRYSICWRK